MSTLKLPVFSLSHRLKYFLRKKGRKRRKRKIYFL